MGWFINVRVLRGILKPLRENKTRKRKTQKKEIFDNALLKTVGVLEQRLKAGKLCPFLSLFTIAVFMSFVDKSAVNGQVWCRYC